MTEFTYLPGTGWLVGGGLAVALVVVWSYLWAKGRSKRWQRWALSAVRWLVVAAVIYCLFDPEWIEAIKHQQKSRVAVLLDSSRSMSIKDLPQERLAAAKGWLQQELHPAVPANFSLAYYSFQEGLTPVTSLEGVHADGAVTGLADALEGLLAVPNEDPLTGVVLCSDGIENLRRDPEAVARMFRRKGIPIHTLTIGTTNDPQDIIIENVQVRRAVPNQAPTKVTVALRGPGYRDLTIPVEVLRDNVVVATETVRLTGASQKVELDFTPRQKGFQIFEVRVPAQTGEWLTSNNRRLFGLEVIDPTIRVLYVEGTPQQPNSPIPEWKYLKSALESDPNIKVKTLYRQFGANGRQLDTLDTDPETGERIYPVEHRTRGFPRTLNSLMDYDVIIHSDIRMETFTAEQLNNMARLVEEYGGGFIMIGGNSAFGKGGYHRTILDRIIPVAMHQKNDSDARPIRFHVPTAAWSHPIIALGATREETELIWTKKFPLLYGCNLVDRAKPGATVLGDDPASRGVNGPRLLMAVQNVGKGRSMAFTSDTTRTWGKDFETLWGERINPALPLNEANCDSRYYRQFWVNAIRWLAAGRTGRTNNAVTLELAQGYCQPNEKIKANIRVRDKALREISGAEVSLLASTDEGTNVIVAAAFNGVERCYVAELALPKSGTFMVTAVAKSKGIKLGDDRQLLVCEGIDRELADLRANQDLMASIARLSGGKSLSLAENESSLMSSVFYNAPPVTVEYRRNPLWDRSWILGGILGLLTLEWAARRLTGMA